MQSITYSAADVRWPLSRVLILLLAGGFAGLMVDIRVEHVDAVREHTVAWLPILYAGFMTIACLVAVIRWSKAARTAMIALFLAALAVGGIGFYFHTHGNVRNVVKTSINAWTRSDMSHSDAPPQVAPLAFGGFGMIGVLASLKRFNA
jgi:hypothetical protein